MKYLNIQIRNENGSIENREIDNYVDLDMILCDAGVEKVSFEIVGGARIALRVDGTYQIFGGLLNYPRF